MEANPPWMEMFFPERRAVKKKRKTFVV